MTSTAHDLCPAATLAAGDELHGFQIEAVTAVPEVRATVYQARHLATGARFLHVHCDDRENLFTLTFRTPPEDSTGVAHILEHSVLSGSKHYPVKDAFNTLIRTTLNTFVNAFTAPDFTCYPVCSQVRADFYNLASVYTDLALRPLLARSRFMQEGHHLELDDDGKLVISGIVYNEMKGAYSTPERISQSATLQGLFPDTPYGVESGGLPEEIPNLTYEQFTEFHRKYYSPSNAWIFFYGNLPTADHLEFLAPRLEGFERIEVDSVVPAQPRWNAPREVRAEFPVGADDPLERKATVNIGWLTAPAADLQERLTLEVLQEALIGNAAAPLRKALIESGLGEDLSPATGLATWYKQLPFCVGLRGTDADQAEAIEALTLETLERLGRDGIPDELLEAAIHQVEFKGLEVVRRPMPFSIELLFRTLSTWLHENDPIVPLTFPSLMADLRERWRQDPDLFCQAIQRWFVENPHRLRAIATPSRTLAADRERELRAALDARQAQMSEEELAAVRTAAEELRREQREPDSPEAIATLPKLQVEEIPTEVESIPTAEEEAGGVRLLRHELFSNSIAYLDVAFDTADIDEELQPYLPLLGAAATGMGAAGEGYEQFATRKALTTGGVAAELDAHEALDRDATVQLFLLRSSALARNIPAMVGVMRDILTAGDLSDADRLRDILNEHRNGLRASVAPLGHRFAWRLAASGLSLSAWRDEQWNGAAQIRFLNEVSAAFKEDPARLTAPLERLRGQLLQRGRMTVNVTGDAAVLDALTGPVGEMVAAVPAGGAAGTAPQPALAPARVAVAIPGEVSYVARVLPVPRHNEEPAAALHVLATHLGSGYLYQKIRVEGGAYGGMAVYSPIAGQLVMLSYRDPNFEKTIATYDAVIDAFLSEELSGEDLRSLIVGAIGRLERPLDPAQKGRLALERTLLGITDAERQRLRERVLAVTADQLKACARDVLKPALARAVEAAYAPKERIERANAALGAPFEIRSLE